MIKIKFIVPSWHHLHNPFLHQPYWEMYYSTILKNNLKEKKIEFELSIIDTRGNPSLVNDIEEADFFLYWIFKTADAIECFDYFNILKDKYPNSIHIAGGTHIEKSQEECSNIFDSIIVGPGENSFPLSIIDHLSKKREKIYMQRWQECKFSDYPHPDRSFLPVTTIVNKELFSPYANYNGTMTYFSRGCIYKCGFCTLNVPGYLQIRSGIKIKEEIEDLKKNYSVNAILLKDEIAIHPNKKVSTEFLESIGNSNIIWRGQTTTQATYEQLKMAKESGCVELAIGVETVDDEVMKIINKSWQDKKQILTFIENAKKLNIKIKICIILGLPGETLDIVKNTIDFIQHHEIEFVNVSGFAPLPGSPIFNDYKNYGIKFIDKDWSKHGHLLYKFSDEEDVGLPFEYEKNSKWGKTFTPQEIANNIMYLQNWLRENNKSY